MAFKLGNDNIHYLYDYHPYKILGQKNPSFNGQCGLLLDLKERSGNAIAHFIQYITPIAKKDEVICVVPSHDPDKKECGTKDLAKILIQKAIWEDGCNCLIRTKKIQKLATGGDRDIDVHLESVEVTQTDIISGKDVILLDDITTTGNSLKACRQLLLEAGAKSVKCYALGKTI